MEGVRELLKNQALELKIEMKDVQIENFLEYMKILLEWNEKMNLTAITIPEEVILKHFIDSLTVLKFIKNENNVVDIGTGAGFPGIPLAIIKKNAKYTLVDSLNKRINFLQEVVTQLQLEHITTIHSRAEDFGIQKINKAKYDVVLSRAVASLPVLLEYMLPLLKIGGICICMKGNHIEEELNNSQKALKELGGEIEKIDKIILPNSTIERNNIIIRKERETPKKYPRKAGIPDKQPII